MVECHRALQVFHKQSNMVHSLVDDAICNKGIVFAKCPSLIAPSRATETSSGLLKATGASKHSYLCPSCPVPGHPGTPWLG